MLRGNIYMAELHPIQDNSVQGGCRPVIIVQNDIGNIHSPNVQVIPLTSQKKKYLPVHVPIHGNGLIKKSIALTEQLTTISKADLQFLIGKLDDDTMQKINNSIRIQLGLA
ncbi:MAG TPA: type II toxin-antitoxin system PemK/MazF family toxin [Ruminococcus flavefaciens]|nr:type II toxin-antitoxin system PemK/MazF family toxin [Ruminococcus flavefaciens]